MKKQYYLTASQICAVYKSGKEFISADGNAFRLIKEKEGKLENLGEGNSYNSAYERINEVWIEDKEGNKYYGTTFEEGDDKNDMQITTGTFFDLTK